MSRLRGLPEDIRSSIMQFSQPVNAREAQEELDVPCQRLLYEIQMIDPTFDLASLLAKKREELNRRRYLFSSPTMDLYRILSRSKDWSIESQSDNEIQIDIYDMNLDDEFEEEFGDRYTSYPGLIDDSVSTGFLTVSNSNQVIRELREIDTLHGYVAPQSNGYSHSE